MKYPRMDWGTMEAVVNKLGGEKGVGRFLRDEITISKPTRSWHEENGVIYLSVTSDGTTGEDWKKRLEINNFRIDHDADFMICDSKFKPTRGITTKIAILKGMLFETRDRIGKNIYAEAEHRKFTMPNPEVACLIRENFSDDELEVMGIRWIVVMHKAIEERLLAVYRGGNSGSWLYHILIGNFSDFEFNRFFGFAFVVSEIKHQMHEQKL